MNKVIAIGRLTKDPVVKYASSGTCVARFSLALDRGKKDGESLGADYPNCVAFGKTAELIEKYVTKGSQIAIVGHITTGSYDKNGEKVYTTDITVENMEFLNLAKREDKPVKAEVKYEQAELIPDDEIPFGD